MDDNKNHLNGRVGEYAKWSLKKAKGYVARTAGTDGCTGSGTGAKVGAEEERESAAATAVARNLTD